MSIETKLFLENRNQETDLYIARAIKNAEKDSEFEKRVRNIKNLPEEEIIMYFKSLKEQNYNALLGYLNEKIIGHVAYQEHRNNEKREWHAFQYYIIPKERGKNYANYLMKQFLKIAVENNIDNIILGKKEGDPKGNAKMKALIQRIQSQTKFKVDLENHTIHLK